MTRQKRLGRGLEVLLEAGRHAASGRDGSGSDDNRPAADPAAEKAVDSLRPGRYQPRRQLSEESLAELADSIRQQGVLQPLIVRVVPPGTDEAVADSYEIVAGERRWRAARMGRLATVPVVVRELDDKAALAVALIENLQREDLNPLDQARSLSRLATEFELTHEQVAKALGRSRASVSNLLRLLNLHDDVKDLLANGGIDMGHARALLALDGKRQLTIARKTKARGLSVRQVEELVRTQLLAPANEAKTKPGIDLQTRWLQQQIAKDLGRKLTIRPGKDGNYALHIGFGELAELEDALQRIQELIAQIRRTAGPRVRDTIQ